METRDSVRRARPLLGTFVEICAAGPACEETERAVEAAFETVARVHRLMSFHDPESDVSRLNREASFASVTVDPWTHRVLEAAIDMHRHSGGVFDVAVAPLLQRLRLLPPDDNKAAVGPRGTNTLNSIELLSGHRVRFGGPGVRIDLGGIAKGFAVDRAVDTLRAYNQNKGLVNAGGDLFAFGPSPRGVHIRDPNEPRRPLCHINVANAALASSGRLFNPYDSSHAFGASVIDPVTQASTQEIAGATVRGPSCMVADALTKIAMICGERALPVLKQHQASALLVLNSGEIRVTSDWYDAISIAA